MYPRRPACRTFRFGAALVGSLAALAVAGAQQPTSTQPTTSQPAEGTESTAAITAETSTIELGREIIEARLSQVESATDLPETAKVEIRTLYNQTLEQIGQHESWSARIRDYETRRKAAPQDLINAKAQLATATSQPRTQPSIGIDDGETLEQLTQRLAQNEAELQKRRDDVKRLDDETKTRTDRKNTVPDLLTDASKRLEKTQIDLAASTPPDLLPRIVLARRTLLLARKQAIEHEIRSYQEELQFYDARAAVLAANLELARANVAQFETNVKTLEEAAGRLRREEIDRQREQARDDLLAALPSLRAYAADNRALVEERDSLGRKISARSDQPKSIADLKQQIDRDFGAIRDIVAQPGISDVVGYELGRKRSDLNELRSYERELQAIKAEMTRTRARLLKIDHELDAVRAENAVDDLVHVSMSNDSRVDPVDAETRVAGLVSTRAELLDKLRADYERYYSQLFGLSVDVGLLVEKIESFSEFIDKHVLWVRSTTPLHQVSSPPDLRHVPAQLRSLGTALARDVGDTTLVYVLALLVAGILFGARVRIRRRLEAIALRTGRVDTDSFGATFEAILCTVLLSLDWAFVTWFLGWRVGAMVDPFDAQGYEMTQAVSAGLRSAAMALLLITLVRRTCRAKGLAESHFRWSANSVRTARRQIAWSLPFAAALIFLIGAAEGHTEFAWRDSVGRIAFIALGAICVVVLHRLFRPSTGILANRFRTNRTGWLYNLRHVWHLACVGLPLALSIASAAGFHYTAVRVGERLVQSFGLAAALVFLHALLVRWLFVAQRRLALKKAAETRKKQEADGKPDAKPQGGGEPTVTIAQAGLSLVDIGGQTRKLLRTLFAFTFIIGIWLMWGSMLPALSFMDGIHLSSYLVDVVPGNGEAVYKQARYITLTHVVLAVLIAIATVVLAKNIPGVLEIAVLSRLPMDASSRFAATAVARYSVIVIGVVVAFGAIGIGWSNVQWLVAAITVGLGFGLQEVFANFVSGLIILFERPIRLGDTVTVGGLSGTVTRIRIRATTITDWDRKELIIPNKEFVTGQIMNWSLSDRLLRLIVKVGIAYGSDIRLAKQLLLDVAAKNHKVLSDPKPKALFQAFGESSLDFELRTFVKDIDDYILARDTLHMEIDDAFREAGIEIAFPQRDLHIRSLPDGVNGTLGARSDLAPAQVANDSPVDRPADRVAPPLPGGDMPGT